ncbi:hypothetical protein Mgra_00007450 [Meloidogyne graminicola]|uniref:Uncharacterized protein n=1 Tax=Meloidogyne graminicola TaxID=189291 RepID=A0A8S9ZJ01_9BILA|nr:hypothetical protein Mgra_00007450 [Meloidogyne graminicola]
MNIKDAQDSTMKEVPILLVGNKIDLRNAPGAHENSSSFVSKKEGENLAELLSTDFIETSALDGTNVETALLLLVGSMMKSEDDHLKQTALILQSSDKKKWKCMSCVFIILFRHFLYINLNKYLFHWSFQIFLNFI